MDAQSSEPPAYTEVPPPPLRDPVTHSVSLQDGRGVAFATLNVVSRALSSEHAPTLYEGEALSGSLDLKLEEQTAVKSIIVSLAGDLVVGMNLRFTFAEVSQTLWSPPDKEERNQSIISSLLRSHPDTKLQGEFHWPFTLVLPGTADLPDTKGGPLKTYRLPQTFLLPTFPAYIVYRVVARINYAGLLRTNEFLHTNVTYIVKSKPPPPSPARSLAYECKAAITGPAEDSDGWHTLEPVAIRGTAFSNKPVNVTYTLSLAKPLSYTRSSVIPLHISVHCADPSVLDLLSSPNAPAVDLLSTQSMGYDIWPETNMQPTQVMQRKLYLADVKDVPDYRHMTLSFATAVWWTMASNEKGDPNTRELLGEIHLPATLQPTIRLARFNYFYRVAMYPPSATDFKPQSKEKDKLAVVPVEICTYFADGPRPVAYSPPVYKKFNDSDVSATTEYNPMLVPFY